MEPASIKFNSIESLSRFVLSLNCGYLINLAALTVKGRFTPEIVLQAKTTYGAEEINRETPPAPEVKDWL